MIPQTEQTGSNEPSSSSTRAPSPPGPPAPPGEATFPPCTPLIGHTTAIVPLQPSHAESLFRHLGGEENLWRWTYLPESGHTTFPSFQKAVAGWCESRDFVFYTVLSGPDGDDGAEPIGLISYLAVVPRFRRLEVGFVIFGGPLTRSRRATEAFYLFLRHAFEDLGYTRVEWKANALNAPSRNAALRLGFGFEGVFRYVQMRIGRVCARRAGLTPWGFILTAHRKHMIVKGRFRDSAYYAMTDDDWPAVKRGFEAWLDESNFDENGRQRRGLKECRED